MASTDAIPSLMNKQTLHQPSPVQFRRQHRPKLPLSVLTAILVVLGLQFIVLPRYVYQASPSDVKLNQFQLNRLDAKLLECAASRQQPIQYPVTKAGSRSNPRWNPVSGQKETIILRNATLFDGETILSEAVDIVLKKGIVESVTLAGKESLIFDKDTKVLDLEGGYVTPGLVDMHSHHLAFAWPLLPSTDDTNEVNPELGPITSQVRIIDSIKSYDMATEIIASGGVTTSLILPGSANIMGGEAVLVKNALKSGENAEFVVEEILLEHGIPVEERRRYMKMACGENPRRVYKHTRMGNAWYFRKHMERAQELLEMQDATCIEAEAVKASGDLQRVSSFVNIWAKETSATDYLEYDSTIAMLRGQVGINVHCYESEDFWDMIQHSKEFGFRIQAFHHALEAWQVPEMIKESGENITIATFSEFALYKKEAYEANLWAGKILAEHGVPVAYKSDHVQEETNAKYLLFQAATAHSFHLSEDLALQSVTSVPAKSLEIDHRVGYVRAGFDADLVLWDSHPLSTGATAIQVYIDGRATLDPAKVVESLENVPTKDMTSDVAVSRMRPVLSTDVKEKLCAKAHQVGTKIVVTGISTSFLDETSALEESRNLTMVIDNGKIACLDIQQSCASVSADGLTIHLENGFVIPGLTAVTSSLGLAEIFGESSSSDGRLGKDYTLDASNIAYAKYGIHLDGKAFGRAKIGGVTKAITAPIADGFAGGVSVGIKTSGKKTILNGGIFQDDVALHFGIGQGSKGSSLPTVSSAIAKLRQIILDNTGKENIYGKVANGSFPLVVHVENEYDIMQLIKIKEDFATLKLVIFGGTGAPLVADELAKEKIPVILTANRGAPDTFEKRNALPGPPLSRSPAAVLSAAGVKYGLAIQGEGDSHIHNLPIEAAWAAKYAGLSTKQALDLVSTNIEEILGLAAKKDFVVFEGNPLEFGASVVLSIDGEDASISTCWPESN